MSDRTRLCPEDIFRFRSAGDPQLSPDCRWVAWVRASLDPVKDRSASEIWCTEIATGEHRRLTAGPADRAPRWSPCGKYLAFTATRDGRGGLWLLPFAGGGEASRIADRQPDSAPVWAPDGAQIAFLSQVFSRPEGWQPYPGCPGGDDERARRQADRLERPDKDRGDENDKELTDPAGWMRESDARVVVDTLYRMDGEGYYGDRRRQIFVVPLPRDGEEPAEARQITGGEYSHGLPAWSPCGRYLAYTALREPYTRENSTRTDLWLLDLEGGEERHLLRAAGPVAGLSWSPDGDRLAFSGHGSEYDLSTVRGLFLLDLQAWRDRGEPLGHRDLMNLTADLDRPVGWGAASDVGTSGRADRTAFWNTDGDALYFLVGDRGGAAIYTVKYGGPAEPVLSPPATTMSGLCAAPSGTAVLLMGTALSPPDLFVTDLATMAEPRRLTSLNDRLLSGRTLGSVYGFSYEGADGWDMDGWLIMPPGEAHPVHEHVGTRLDRLPVPATPRPLVVFVHGGPHGAYGDAFYFGMQAVAATGAAVLYTTPRGSDCYGQEFMNGVIEDWGGKDYQDVMAGIDALVEAGVADQNRLGITGWSYGGYMTNWSITQTDRFRAALAGASLSNMFTDYGTTDTGIGFDDHNFGGVPWEKPDAFLSRSAIMHVARCRTPLLLLHGEDDMRCDIGQAEEMFTALRRLGHEVYMVLYPGEYHGLKKPRHMYDRVLRTVSWFRHRLAAD